MAIEVFNRQELKFVITKAQYMSMLPEITRHMRLDIHNNQGQAYRLYNLYIDTEDVRLFGIARQSRWCIKRSCGFVRIGHFMRGKWSFSRSKNDINALPIKGVQKCYTKMQYGLSLLPPSALSTHI